MKGDLCKTPNKYTEVVINDTLVQVHRNFKMVISSVESAPSFDDEITEFLTLVSFELTEAAFEAQLMAVVIQTTEAQNEIRQRMCRQEIFENVAEVKSTEARILDMLDQYRNSNEMIANDDLIQ
jgi:hypothetical protein